MKNGDQPNPSAMSNLDERGRYRPEQGYPEPHLAGDEAAMLLAFPERQRATVAWKVGGLDATRLRTTLGSSTMTLGGMLKHLARFEDDMSHEWLLGQGQLPPWDSVDWDAERDWDWRTAAYDTPEAFYDRWREAVVRSRSVFEQVLAAGRLEQPAMGIADEDGNHPNARCVLLNMIEEYAHHNGHADLIREPIDGLVGHDPPK